MVYQKPTAIGLYGLMGVSNEKWVWWQQQFNMFPSGYSSNMITCSLCLNIAVQLQHHARHRLPTFQLIFVHVIESLVFVPVSMQTHSAKIYQIYKFLLFFPDEFFFNSPIVDLWSDRILCSLLQIMIGILFFLFEFYDDQLLAFVVLILVWLSELFTLIRSLSSTLFFGSLSVSL